MHGGDGGQTPADVEAEFQNGQAGASRQHRLRRTPTELDETICVPAAVEKVQKVLPTQGRPITEGKLICC
jgi:hypothetical protein